MHSLFPSLRLGILGGGQLARMLAHSAQRVGLMPVIFTAHRDDPAAQVSPRVILGTLKSVEALRRFFSEVDLVLFENEFVPCDLLRTAAEGTQARFVPGLEAMEFLQDKLNQKQTLTRLKIPTSRYVSHREAGKPPFEDWLRALSKDFDGECVLKWAQLGYDGKGTFFFSGRSPAALQKALVFCNEATLKGVDVYAEEKIPFKREVALIAAHSTSGEFAAYPLVISEQTGGVCFRVTGPATALGVPRKLQTAATRHAEKLARELGLHGVFAIEFFETRQGKLLVNEIAPRVHNTGHFSLDAAETSQFENHLRATLGLPLGSMRTAPAFAMLNLLGPPGARVSSKDVRLPALAEGTHLHWYGKGEISPGRKMGHLAGSATSAAKLKTLIAELNRSNDAWVRSLKG